MLFPLHLHKDIPKYKKLATHPRFKTNNQTNKLHLYNINIDYLSVKIDSK